MLLTESKPELFRKLDEFIDLAAPKTRKSLGNRGKIDYHKRVLVDGMGLRASLGV